MPVIRFLVALLGALLVVGVVMSAMRTVVLPRGEPVRIFGALFWTTRKVFNLALRARRGFRAKDRLMAHFAPVTLLLLPLVWLGLTWLGFAALLWGVEGGTFEDALALSGSSLVTLGFDRPATMPGLLLCFLEGALAISVLALLLVTYLPSMYAAFSDREQQVALLEVRAGTPPSPVEMMTRLWRIDALWQTTAIWREWERWFARVSESHTSLPALVFFRSPDPRTSWITAAGAVLDAAALMAGVVDLSTVAAHEDRDRPPTQRDGAAPRVPEAHTCIRSGFLALRNVADLFDLPYDPAPARDDPISVTRAEFDAACDALAADGVPLRADRDQAWRDWAGWRVNYDAVLLQLAALFVAPPTPWVTDREPVGLPAASRRARMVRSLAQPR